MNRPSLETLCDYIGNLRYELGDKIACVDLATVKLENYKESMVNHKDLLVIEEVLELLKKI